MKILSIVDTAYRATLEEQDDTILWLNHALRNNGAEVSILLSGNAVNYAVRGQDAAGLAFGDRRVAHPPRLDEDLARLIAAKVAVFAVEEDIRERALPADRLVAGIQKLSRAGIPEAIERFDQVWRW
jgi:sulfur relay (sulfurtransferase) DsrF/TusC family protein